MNLVKKISQNIFREYDLRGIYNEEIDEDVAYTLGKSFGTYMQLKGKSKTIIGHDNRVSSPSLSSALIQGILDTGMDVIDLGLVTTPMYYYSKIYFNIDNGIMITASHNPKEYNGFKMSFDSIGNAYGQMIRDFRDFTNENNFKSGNGTLEKKDIKDAYIELINKSINLGDKKIKSVIDCGNGTGSIIIKEIFDKLNIEYFPINCVSDGNFPNHHPDPSVSKNMIELSKKVVELNFDLGIGIDGDADRVGIVDENGNIISADLYMIIVYRYLANNIKNKSALFDVKCSKSLIDELDKLNLKKVMYRTGNSYMNMKMQEGNFDFGGEYSGHIWYRDKFPGFDDGIYAALRIVEILSNLDKPLSSLLDGINKYYSTEEIKIEVSDDIKFRVVEDLKEYCVKKGYKFIDIDGIRVEFEDGWALIRCSNTGPNVTMRFEAKTQDRLEELNNEFTNKLMDIIKNH